MKNCIIVFVSVFYLWYENNFLPFRHIIIMQKKKRRRKTTIKINVFLAAIKACLYIFVPETNMIRLYLSIIWNISEINFKSVKLWWLISGEFCGYTSLSSYHAYWIMKHCLYTSYESTKLHFYTANKRLKIHENLNDFMVV